MVAPSFHAGRHEKDGTASKGAKNQLCNIHNGLLSSHHNGAIGLLLFRPFNCCRVTPLMQVSATFVAYEPAGRTSRAHSWWEWYSGMGGNPASIKQCKPSVQIFAYSRLLSDLVDLAIGLYCTTMSRSVDSSASPLTLTRSSNFRFRHNDSSPYLGTPPRDKSNSVPFDERNVGQETQPDRTKWL